MPARERALVGLGLAGAFALAWAYLLAGAGTGMPALEMSGLPTAAGIMAGMEPIDWDAECVAVMLAMWAVMMAAMMLPAATPAVLRVAARARALGRRPVPAAGGFAAGYLAVWGGFGAAAVAAQFALDRLGLLAPEMATAGAGSGAALLIGAGAWQLAPARQACLRRGRALAAALDAPLRDGAWRLGLRHGALCLGSSWAMMALLFYGGVMNVYWIAGLSLYLLAEKAAPAGARIGRLAGLVLIAAGLVVLAGLAGAARP